MCTAYVLLATEDLTAPQQPWWARVEMPPAMENALDQAGEDVAKVFGTCCTRS